MYEGPADAKVLFVSDFLRVTDKAEGRILSEYVAQPLLSAIKSAGLLSSEWAITVIHPHCPMGGKDVTRIDRLVRDDDLVHLRSNLSEHKANVIVPLGSYALSLLCGLDSIDKWHCNIIQSTAEYGLRKCIPLFHPDHVIKCYGDSAYLSFGCMRIKDESHFPELKIPHREFNLGPSLSDSIDILQCYAEPGPPIAIDIETGGGLINTVGIAPSDGYAVAIKTLPDHYGSLEYLQLWQAIARVMEGPRPKILQNFIYEASWFARYGIELKNTVHDTMWAMKFLHPEFEKGLHNVGRIYTKFPYWKDDNDDWNLIRDWLRHLDYNCKDTTGTFAAYENQLKALESRNLLAVFTGFVMRFAPVIQEMCASGLRVDPQALVDLQEKLNRKAENFNRIIELEAQSRLGRSVNARSPKQVKQALKDMGMKLPVQKGKESSDKKALVKLRKKYPDDQFIQSLVGLSATNKQLSSYINFEYDRGTSRVHYALDGCGTETGRWSGYNSGWGEGFNPQTVPKSVRQCFIADPGFVLIQIDLAQAESRYVAWESPEPKLMEMLEDGRDIHKYVASQIYRKPPEIVNDRERQLGKKSGHAANYGVGPRTFSESCLVEMDLVLEEREAKRIIETYFEIFPGILSRQRKIKNKLFEKRKLVTPIGRERHFYGRMNDATFREAYAYAPQSTIPDITNHLMLKLWEDRDYLDIDKFLLQVHDSLLIQAPKERAHEIADYARDLKVWHPKISLAGGELWIPVSVEMGRDWKNMSKI